MTTPVARKQNNELLAEDVVAYLRQHPEFFTEHEYLLNEIRLPHRSGVAVSLVERQLTLFREQRDRYEQQLGDLIEIARQNDRFFDKSKRLIMNLIEAQSLDEVMIVLEDSFLEDFGVDFCSLLVFARRDDYPLTSVAMTSEESARAVLGDLLDHHKAICGPLAPVRAQFLFHKQPDQVASAAIIPLRHTQLVGVLSIGSRKSDHFDSSMGSLFLTYISESLSRLLLTLLNKERRSRF